MDQVPQEGGQSAGVLQAARAQQVEKFACSVLTAQHMFEADGEQGTNLFVLEEKNASHFGTVLGRQAVPIGGARWLIRAWSVGG